MTRNNRIHRKKLGKGASTRYVALGVLLAVIGIVLILRHGQIDSSWPRVDGIPVEGKVTRIVVGGATTHDVLYEGVYRMKFVAGGKEHSAWINTHLKAPDENTLRDAMRYQISHHVVFRLAYNPANLDEVYLVE